MTNLKNDNASQEGFEPAPHILDASSELSSPVETLSARSALVPTPASLPLSSITVRGTVSFDSAIICADCFEIRAQSANPSTHSESPISLSSIPHEALNFLLQAGVNREEHREEERKKCGWQCCKWHCDCGLDLMRVLDRAADVRAQVSPLMCLVVHGGTRPCPSELGGSITNHHTRRSNAWEITHLDRNLDTSIRYRRRFHVVVLLFLRCLLQLFQRRARIRWQNRRFHQVVLRQTRQHRFQQRLQGFAEQSDPLRRNTILHSPRHCT